MITHVGQSFIKLMSKIDFIGHDEAKALLVGLVWSEESIFTV